MSTAQRFTQVDAFTDRPFAGNPAAVCLLEAPADDHWMQRLAPYWAGKLRKTRLVGYQASPRGGVVTVELNRDRVRLGGHAVTVLRGELLY